MSLRMRISGMKAILFGGLLALLMAGCEGRNLFGPGAGLGPQMIVFTVPATVRAGEELRVQARAVSSIRVDSIVVTAVSADFNGRQKKVSENNETDLSASLGLMIPSVITDTLVIVTGIAWDAQGNASIPIVDTVRAIDTTPPTAGILLTDTIVGQARNFQFQVQASDNIGLTWIGYQILNSDSLVVFADSVPTTGKTRTRAFTYAVPVDLPLGMYRVAPIARDIDGNRSIGGVTRSFRVIFIDDVRPGVVILEPPANMMVAEADSVFVRTRVTDNDAVARVVIEGVAFRGNVDLGTDVVVARFAPRTINLSPAKADTTLTRYLIANSLVGAETAHIIVTATDQQGNVSADTVAIQIIADTDPPVVVIGTPGAGAQFQINDSIFFPIPVIATVSDPTGFVRSGVVHVEFRGFRLEGDPALLNQVEIPMFTTQTLTLTPPRILPQAIQRNMVPTVRPDTTTVVYFVVTARDARGNIGADTVSVLLTRDNVAPSITIIEPAGGTGVPMADSLLVRARVQDVDGVVSVTFDGVAHRGDRDLGTHQEVIRFLPRTVNLAPPVADTIISRYLQQSGDITSEPVYIRVVARDVGGNIRRDSVLVTLGGPRVQLPDLVPGTAVPAGTILPIRVTAQDPSGINLVTIEITGADNPPLFQDAVLVGQNPNSIDLTYNYTIPALASGPLNIRARARNSNSIFGASPLVTLNVVGAGGGSDVTPPEVRILVQPQGSGSDPNRIEVTDPIRVSVTARDNTGGAGVDTTGYTVRAVRRGNLADTLWITQAIAPGIVGGTVTRIFNPTLLLNFEVSPGVPFYDPVNRPDTIDLDFFGWAVDAALPAPNCGAAISPTVFQQLTCTTISFGGDDFRVAQGSNGQRVVVSLVSGETVRIPHGGSIADVAVHAPTERLFLSNIGRGWVEVFDPVARVFLDSIPVGSEPWGIATSANPNLLYVGNSGGTNISRIDLTVGPVGTEVLRIGTPNSLLWDVEERVVDGVLVFNPIPYDFSDRPQFAAEDSQGRIVYSTRPTGAAPDGSIRLLDFTVGSDPESILFTGHAAITPTSGWFAFGNIDRILTAPGGIFMRTHRPGERISSPGAVFTSAVYTGLSACPPLIPMGTCGAFSDLLAQVQAAIPADNLFHPYGAQGRWNIESVGLTDTTFIAVSGNRSVVAIGEGMTAATGRIFLWRAAEETITDAISVADLVGNAAERVMGVAMNEDGQMGVGRGLFGIYFFDRELRLIGSPAIGAGGSGVALHPFHVGEGIGTPPHVAYAFVPVGNNTVQIFNTRNYFQSGRIHIRDTIVGPLRSAAPFAGDNAGLTCIMSGGAVDIHNPATDSACVAVKLYGITSGGGVVVIDATKGDILSGL